jgi:hypothetical protein
MLGNELEKLKLECNKLRLVYMTAETKALAVQHNLYLCDIEDILRDRHTLADKGWTLEQFLSIVNNILQNMKELKNECVQLQNEVFDKKVLRLKQKSKSSLIEHVQQSTSSLPSPFHDTVE